MAKSRKLTTEEKARMAPMLRTTWEAIAPDAEPLLSSGRSRLAELIEMTCDANRAEMFGGMSHEDYEILMEAYDHPDTKKWLRAELNY